jgi:hypothetical protein
MRLVRIRVIRLSSPLHKHLLATRGFSKIGEEGAIRRSPLRGWFPYTVSEVGESSKRSDLHGAGDGKLGEVGVDGYSEVVVSAMGIAPALGITFGGNEKRFMDLLNVLEEGQHREDEGFVSKPKGWRERKNLECSINFDARGNGSSRGFFFLISNSNVSYK